MIKLAIGEDILIYRVILFEELGEPRKLLIDPKIQDML